MMKTALRVLMLLVVFLAPWLSAGELEITSFSSDGVLVFDTGDSGTVDHHYRIEACASLMPAAWSVHRTVSGAAPATCVSNAVTTGTGSAFYRVVSTSNSAVFVDGPYMVIDVSGGTNAASYPVVYYPTSADIRGGVTNDAYKTTNILMRLIPKGTFIMGSPPGELGRWDHETEHQVTLTQPFYIGVFEVTQRQWERVMGTWPSYFTNVIYRDYRPVEQVGYNMIRGSSAGAGWPANGNVDADSFMGQLRARTGLAFDLPTESQWEYAGRAGTTAALNSGKNLTSIWSCPNMSDVGRYWYNGGSNYVANGDTSVGTAKEGTYLANAWGLYDIHGNAWEWCLDWYGTYPGTASDPKGAGSGSYRVYRGGSWDSRARRCRVANRLYSYPSRANGDLGFRLASPH
jgi:formylglycine-generating enzyme required for sulfatase activity